MKRILLLLILFSTGFNLVKAQQFLQVKPQLKLTDSLKGSFKQDTYLSPKSLLLQPIQQENSVVFTNNTKIVYSRMPVVKLAYGDHMPVAGAGKSDDQDKMPVLKVTVIDPIAKNETPIP